MNDQGQSKTKVKIQTVSRAPLALCLFPYFLWFGSLEMGFPDLSTDGDPSISKSHNAPGSVNGP